MTDTAPLPDEVMIPATRDDQGRRIHQTRLTPVANRCPKIVLAREPAVIPLIFLPGIMGTNLKSKASGKAVWRPPNATLNVADVLGIIGALVTWGTRGPKKRQELLSADDLVVDDGGSIDVADSCLSKEVARARGWGSVSRTSYNPFMALMEQRGDAMVLGGALQAFWEDEALRAPADYGEQHGQPALTEEEIMRAAHYQYDVWCGGYNWLQSNRDSGKDIIDTIDKVLAHYVREDIPADKVILVTHSMGGFVSRAVTELHGCDKVLGVISGVQPATGAPAIYHHMRSGYEGPSQIILGRNSGEVTAVVANAPGALELTPTFDHAEGRGWLCFRDSNSIDAKPPLPASGDPYGEIYTNPAWYGLVPEQNARFLDLSKENDPSAEIIPRDQFNESIREISVFHSDIARKYRKDVTYAHYGADDSDAMHSWKLLVWQGDASLLEAPGAIPNDDGNGSYRNRRIRNAPEITKVKGAGDGTVPVESGAAPGLAGVKASFRQGSLGEGQFNNMAEGYGHQESYNDARARWAALYSVVKLAQLADWHPDHQDG